MADAFLLDTCAAIWIVNRDPLREPGASVLEQADAPGGRLFVSPITAWEVALLAAKERLGLAINPETWFDGLLDRAGMSLAGMPPSVLIASASLPGAPPRDPADSILLATARAYGHTLVTRDRALLAYGAAGHARVLEC